MTSGWCSSGRSVSYEPEQILAYIDENVVGACVATPTGGEVEFEMTEPLSEFIKREMAGEPQPGEEE